MPEKPVIFSIGHSTRTFKEFRLLLEAHGVKQLIDVRTIPRSRHNPQFNERRLAAHLKMIGISYLHDKELGGLRHAQKDSVNAGWRNTSFRGYADYMQTDEFAEALRRLTAKAKRRRTAIMCAEAVPWRCHRSLIADALVKQNWEVRHITSAGAAHRHKLASFARMKKGKLYYPEPKQA